MRKCIILFGVIALSFLLSHCASNQLMSPQNPEPQSSVKIKLKNGLIKEGLIFKGDDKQLLYVSSVTHKPDTLLISNIKQIEHNYKHYDFDGYEMPRREIKKYKKYSKTLLYAGGGMVLGVAAGTGIAVALFSPKEEGDEGNSSAAIATMSGFSLAGAGFFGWLGAKADFKEAVFKTRKMRYARAKKTMDKKRKELEQLKREKIERKQ